MLLELIACAANQPAGTDGETLPAFAFQERYLTAVPPFISKAEQVEYGNLSRKLEDLAMEAMLQTGRFRLVERSRMEAVLKEVELGQRGVIDDQIAGRIGKQLGAELILIGSLTAVKPIEKRDSLGFMWRDTKGFEVVLQGRLIDPAHGEVIAAANAAGTEIQEIKVALGAVTGDVSPAETLLNTAAEKAVRQLVQNLSRQLAAKKQSR